jgi:hypothetical protein
VHVSTRVDPSGGSVSMLIASGLGVLGGIFLVGVMLYFDVTYSNQTSAYDAAPKCASPADTSSCRFTGPAVLARKWSDANSNLRVDIVFENPSVRTSPYIDKAYQAQWDGWHEGQPVTAELWQGRVTIVDQTPTEGNPDKLPNAGLLPVVIFSVVTLALAAWFIYSLRLVRRSYAAFVAARARSG